MNTTSVAKRSSPMLATYNMDATISFYERVLGFAPTMKSPEYSIMERDGQTIHFQKAAFEEVMKCMPEHTEDLHRGFRHSRLMGVRENLQEPV